MDPSLGECQSGQGHPLGLAGKGTTLEGLWYWLRVPAGTGRAEGHFGRSPVPAEKTPVYGEAGGHMKEFCCWVRQSPGLVGRGSCFGVPAVSVL